MLDEVGEALHQLSQPPLVEELSGVVLQMQDDIGAAGRLLDRLDGEVSLSIGLPADTLLRIAGRARDNRYLVGDHERRVKANAELADQVGTVGDVLSAKLFEEGARARLGD